MRNKYNKYFNTKSLFSKITIYFNELNQKAVYSILLLFYAFKRSDTPVWAKNIVIGALGYFISPIDSIPDLTPFLGFTDDLGVLSFGLVMVACYINNEVRVKAKKAMGKFFSNVNEAIILEVDQAL